jgi:hypothetical protein
MAIPTWVLALISAVLISAVAGLIAAAMIIPDARAKRATPERTAKCHAQRGTARLDARGIYRGCLVPPASTR